MKTTYYWLVFTGSNILLLALTAMVNDGLAGWNIALLLAGPCMVWPALRLPPGELLACVALSGLTADAQLPTPPGFLMSLFAAGAMIAIVARQRLGPMRRTQQIGLAWLLNGLYFAAFTGWALARNHGGGANFWEHLAVDFCLSQLLVIPAALWLFDFQNCVLALAGLTAGPHRAADAS
ncbi:MAG TPA: hypothetical protein VHC95_02140 [Opitutales bacterium]|nr:hypothetical protein [Opitutales bacterium]